MASGGLARAYEIYSNRFQRAKELKADGKRIIGYFCCYPPLEMMTALDLVPFRILGDMYEPITKADAYLTTVICPFLRSSFDLALNGRYDFLDGFVGVHACDTAHNVAHIWRYYLQTPYAHFIDIPHTVHEASFEFFREEFGVFGKTLEEFAGREISDERLRGAIAAHNYQRALVRELYDLRKEAPPLLSGAETLAIMVALMSIPLEEGTELLRETITEVKGRRNGPLKQPARLLVWGSPIDNVALIDMIEGGGANVVMDDMCVGTRFYWSDVELTPDPLLALAHRYLDGIHCPRTFRETGPNYWADLENRFGYIKDFAREWTVNGVILQSVKYCDTHGYEVPGLKDYLQMVGFPSLYLEHEYSMVALAPLRTRVEAFLEMIG